MPPNRRVTLRTESSAIRRELNATEEPNRLGRSHRSTRKAESEEKMMIGASRAVATLGAALVAGVLLWAATHMERGENYGYWEAYGIVAAAGLVLALAQIR